VTPACNPSTPSGSWISRRIPDRLAAAQLTTGMRDAAVWGTGAVGGHEVAVSVMDFGFMGGSMGAVVGEKVTRAAEHALAARVPLIVVSASGGARMQEGTLALMQLAKTLGALERLRAAGVPYLSILSDPTTGGVFASFAAVGDVNIAEPDALIGFAGARVTAGTIATELPPGFQRSEFLFSHGFVDRVVTRAELHDELASLLRLLPARGTFDEPEPVEDVPAFRPFSFLTTLADRVGELANGDGTNGDDEKPAELPPTVPAVDDDGELPCPLWMRLRRTTSGPASSSPVPCADLARSSSWTRWPTSSSSSTATVSSATTPRSWPDSPGSKGGASRSSVSRRVPTRTRTSGVTSGCPTRRVTERRCG
jgi:acetyl-CoA carboxylase carboxyl transferase subunit beta